MGEKTDIEVPSHFLCPISMDLMRDPVTVVSGITYDRDSIETWLSTVKNNRTCPVTKQNLSNNSLTPNHTLRRLIQTWCTLHAFERFPSPKPPLDRDRILKLLHSATVSQSQPQMVECLRTLKLLALESQRNKKCLEEAGVPEFLASVINKTDYFDDSEVESDYSNANDEALSVLYHMETSEGGLKRLVNDYGELVGSLIQALRYGKYQSRAYAIQILKSLCDVADPIQLITTGPDLFVQVVRVLTDQISFQSTKAALKLLVELCPWGRNRVKAVEAGSVHALVELLLPGSSTVTAAAVGTERRRCELVLVGLDQLCSCAEGRADLLKHGAGVAVVSKKILRVSHVASDRAVRVLSSVCRYSATERVLQEMVVVGAVAKLCLVVQVENNGMKTKERCRELLRLHARVWKNSRCVPPHFLSSYPDS